MWYGPQTGSAGCKGSIDWLPAGRSVNCHTMTWERFAEMMEKEGTPRQR